MSKGETFIGCHSSISKGVLEAIKYTQYIGGNTTQIFLGNKLSSNLKQKTKISEQEEKTIKKHINDTNHKLFIHTAYILNLCKYPKGNSQIKYAIDNVVYDLEQTEKIGGIGCVLHIGYKMKLEEDEAYQNMIDNIIDIVEKTNKTAKHTKLILETPAGKGSQIGTTLDEFARIWNEIPNKYYNRLGICIDTAHIFSSGIDIRNPKDFKKYIKDFDSKIGIKHLTCFHINDSKEQLNSRKDKHEGIGKGYIFGKDKGGNIMGLKEIWKFAKKNKIPMILETHSGGFYNVEKDNGKYYQEIKLFMDWNKGIKAEKDFSLKDSCKLPETPLS